MEDNALRLSSPSLPRYRRGLRVAIALVLLGLITHGTHAGSGDEPHYVAIAHSLAFDFDLDLANNYGPAEPLIAGGGLEPGSHVRPGRTGVTRPVHDIGLPLLLAPVARLGVPLVHWLARTVPADWLRRVRVTPTILYRHLLSIAMIALALLLASMLFETCLGLGAPPPVALAITLLVSLSPPLLIYSVLTFTELVSALLCLFAFRRLGLDPPSPGGARLESAARDWFVTGAAVGLLLLVHVRNAGLVFAFVCLGGAALRRRGSWREGAGFAMGLATMFGTRTLVTAYFWGTLITTPHSRMGSWPGVAEAARESGLRLAGLFLDQEYGLLVYGPLYLLGLFGLTRLPRPMARRVLFVAGAYLALIVCPVTNVHGWTGAWCPAARMMTPIVPLLAIAVLAGLRASPRPIAAAVVAVQVIVSGYMWQNPKNLWNDGDGVAAVCARGGMGLCDYLPSIAMRSR